MKYIKESTDRKKRKKSKVRKMCRLCLTSYAKINNNNIVLGYEALDFGVGILTKINALG